MPPDGLATREFARRLLDPGDSGDDHLTAAASAQRALECVSIELSKWTGADGGHALLTRAVALAKAKNPELLRNTTVGPRLPTRLEGLTATSSTDGSSAAVQGMESILTELIELLSRLIGDQLAMTLMQPCLANKARDLALARAEETSQ